MIIKPIKFDLSKFRLYEKLKAKQGDTESRFLLFQLLDGSLPFNLENRSVRAYMIKPDGKEVFNDLIINDRVKGYCTLELTNQVLAAPGVVKIELMVTEGTKKLTSSVFELEVDKSINSEKSIVSTNEFTALLNGLASLSEYDNYKNELKDARDGEANIGTNIRKVKSQLETIETKKVNVVDVDNKVWSMANMGQDVKTAMTGGSVAVVGKNAVLTENIVDKQVTLEKTNFSVTGKNLYNKFDVEDGYFINWTNGNKTVNIDLSNSNFIKVKPSTKYVTSINCILNFYTSSKVWISGLNPAKIITTPSNCEYVIVSINKKEKNIFQLELGEVATTYEEFKGELINKNKIELDNKLLNVIKNDVPVLKKINLFDKSNVTDGKQLQTNGGVADNALYTLSEYIEVTPNKTLYTNAPSFYGFYGCDKTFISGFWTNDTGEIFTAPNNASYIRISPALTSKDTFMLSEKPIARYYPYKNILMDNDTELEVNENLFDTFLATKGYFVNWNTGQLQANADLTASGFVMVEPNASYSARYVSMYAFYTDKKVFISGSVGVAGTTSITIPSNARYIRFTVNNNSIDNYGFYKGEMPTITNKLYKGWYGKFWSSLGDSITQRDMYQVYVAKEFGFEKKHYGISGTTIADYTNLVDKNSIMCSDTRINAITDRSDLITVMGGTNDWVNNVPLGTISDTSILTFYGAYKQMLEKLITRFPTKKICCFTPPYGLYGGEGFTEIGYKNKL